LPLWSTRFGQSLEMCPIFPTSETIHINLIFLLLLEGSSLDNLVIPFVLVGDSPEGPLRNRGNPKTCKKQNKTHHLPKHARTARPTLRWPPRPTRVTQSKAPSSRFRLARGLTPPSSGFRLAQGLTPPSSGFRLTRGLAPPRAGSASLEGPLLPRAGFRLARGSLTSAPAPARGYGHLML
jgi:hypothetical protein